MASTIINMLPAIQQLCQLDQSCPLSTAPGTQGIVSQTPPSSVTSGRVLERLKNKLNNSTASQSFASDSIASKDYENLIRTIKALWDSHLFSQIYCERLIRPLYQRLTAADGKAWFEKQLSEPKQKAAFEAVVHAIVQNFSTEKEVSREGIEAAREVTSDLYQTFMQKKCQVDGAAKCAFVPSPIPYWSIVDLSTYPNSTAILGTPEGVGIVNIPRRYASQAVLAWGCLGHEVAGHDLLAAYPGAQKELETVIKERMQSKGLEKIAPYWVRWLNEAASDVMGVLHLGPAGAFSLIGFLRAKGRNPGFKLSDIGYLDDTYGNDPHPVELIRAFVVQAAVGLLPKDKFTEASQYAALLEQELAKDLQGATRVLVDLHPAHTEEGKKAVDSISWKSVGSPLSYRYGTLSLQEILTSPYRQEFVQALSTVMPTGKRSLREEHLQLIDGKPWQPGGAFSLDECKNSARIFAEIVMNQPLQALGGKSFGMIRSWSNLDEKICKVFRAILPLEIELVETYKDRFASQVVAAAVMESISETPTDELNPERLQRVFQRMVSTLKILHTRNPEWKSGVTHQAEHIEESPKKSPSAVPATPPTSKAAQKIDILGDDW